MAGYLSDTDLKLSSGSFALVLSAAEPPADILGAAQWIPIPPDASSIVVREYIGDPGTEEPATMDIECIGHCNRYRTPRRPNWAVPRSPFWISSAR